MFDPNDAAFDEEQFIRDYLNFLNESDDEFSEGSENSSIRFMSYEENKSIYGISPISSKVSETWSSNSSGSITSPRELTGPTSSNVHLNTALPPSNFSKEDWYSPFFIEDISFGQDFTTPSRSKEVDSILYKVWSDTFANRSCEYFLREKILRREELFAASKTPNVGVQAHSTYSKLACEMWPYSNLVTSAQGVCSCPRTVEVPSNYLNLGFIPKEHSKLASCSLPIFSTSHTPLPTCGAEEALNRYFTQPMSSLDLTSARSDFSFPIGRTSTPISNTSKVQQFNEDVTGDVAGALTGEDLVRYFERKKFEKKTPCPAPLVLEDFMKAEDRAINTTKPSKSGKSSKQYEFCKFCYKNGELSDIYMSHITKSSDGTIVCPILRKYVCDLCGATGDKAHTRKYCSLNTQQSRRHPVFRRLTNGVLTSCHNHK